MRARSATTPSETSAGVARLASGPSLLTAVSICVAWRCSCCERGGALGREPGQTARRGTQLTQERGQVGEIGLDRPALGRGGRGDLAGVFEEPAEVSALGGQRREDPRGLVGEPRDHAVLVGEHSDHAVGLLERRVRTLERRVQRVAVGVEPDAEPGDEQPQPLEQRQPVHVEQQIEANRGRRSRYRKQVLALARPRVDQRERRRRAGAPEARAAWGRIARTARRAATPARSRNGHRRGTG